MVARQEADDVLYWKDRNLVLFCVVESHSVIMQWVFDVNGKFIEGNNIAHYMYV